MSLWLTYARFDSVVLELGFVAAICVLLRCCLLGAVGFHVTLSKSNSVGSNHCFAKVPINAMYSRALISDSHLFTVRAAPSNNREWTGATVLMEHADYATPPAVRCMQRSTRAEEQAAAAGLRLRSTVRCGSAPASYARL